MSPMSLDDRLLALESRLGGDLAAASSAMAIPLSLQVSAIGDRFDRLMAEHGSLREWTDAPTDLHEDPSRWDIELLQRIVRHRRARLDDEIAVLARFKQLASSTIDEGAINQWTVETVARLIRLEIADCERRRRAACLRQQLATMAIGYSAMVGEAQGVLDDAAARLDRCRPGR